MPARLLCDNDGNPRTHPRAQKAALSGLLKEIGIVKELTAYRSARAGGQLVLIDGHARKEVAPDAIWPVAVLDVTDEEADKLLAALDPIAELAVTDREKMDALLAGVTAQDEALGGFLDSLRGADPEAGPPVEEVPVKPPPRMVWLLVGIPVDRFGEVRDLVLALQEAADITVQSSSDA